jgi:hypothetical protein
MINQMFDPFDRTLCHVKFNRLFDYIIVDQTNALGLIGCLIDQSNTLGSIRSSNDPIILS